MAGAMLQMQMVGVVLHQDAQNMAKMAHTSRMECIAGQMSERSCAAGAGTLPAMPGCFVRTCIMPRRMRAATLAFAAAQHQINLKSFNLK